MADETTSKDPLIKDADGRNLLNEEIQPAPRRSWGEVWEKLVRLGLGETAIRAGTGLASFALILLVVWVMGKFYLKGQVNNPQAEAMAAAEPTITPRIPPPPFEMPAESSQVLGISRRAMPHTALPSRPRFEIIEYEVQSGDTVIGIAERFNLQPQTVLWSNFDVLYDDPHRLMPGQKLKILPVDGLLYEWHNGDGLNGVAEFFKVTPQEIIEWPSNNLTPEKVADLSNPNIEPGTVLLIPGGVREWQGWSNPMIPRSNPASAKLMGPGYCGVVTTGYTGSGTFIWPTTATYISGYNYSPATNHRAVDIGGAMGNALYAADSGVVVYAGWNNYGYGNTVVIDHGNGWQTLYAHIMDGGILVSCGQSVSQGETIAYMGSTGNSSGPHLHFELMHESYGKVNPLDYMSP